MSRSAVPPASARGPTAAARAVVSAELLALRARPTGDAVAAAGLLARAARESGTPFHLRVTRDPTADAPDPVFVGYADREAGAASADTGAADAADSGESPADSGESPADSGADPDTGATRADGTDADAGDPIRVSAAAQPCTVRVAEALREAGIEPAPLVTLAGAVAAGVEPAGESLAAAERAGRVERRPGVAVPTDDPAVGLATTTWLRLPESGDADAVREAFATVEDAASDRTPEARRRLASLVALRATEDAPPSAVQATERLLRPHATDGPFGSVEAYADVFSAVAVADPGLASALAVNPGAVADAARERWVAHGERVHDALGSVRTARYDGVFVCRVGDPAAVGCGPDSSGDAYGVLPSVAETARAFHAPEPRALVVTDGYAAAAGGTDAPVGEALRTATRAADGTATGRSRGVARFEGDVQAFLSGFREAVRP